MASVPEGTVNTQRSGSESRASMLGNLPKIAYLSLSLFVSKKVKHYWSTWKYKLKLTVKAILMIKSVTYNVKYTAYY